MNDLERLIEGLSEKAYRDEPFAQAIALYLESVIPGSYMKILDKKDVIIRRDANLMIKEVKNNEDEEPIC